MKLLMEESKYMNNEYTYNIDLLAGEIAKNFVQVENIEDGIMQSLVKIGKTCGAQRTYIFEISEDGKTMNNTFEWCEEEVEPQIDNLQNLPTSIFPWWIIKLEAGEILDIYDVSELEDFAMEEKRALQEQGVVSVLVFPIQVNNDLKGFVGFDNTKSTSNWKKKDYEVLELVSDLISSAYARRISEEKIRDSNHKLKKNIEYLTNARNQLYRQEHMASIGRLSAGIAHEINNPLSFISSNQQIMKEYTEQLIKCIQEVDFLIDEKTFSGKKEEEILTEMRNRIKLLDVNFLIRDIREINQDLEEGMSRVKKIVDNMLFFSDKGFVEEKRQYNIVEGIKSVLKLVEYRVKDRIAVNCMIDSDVPILKGCIGEINQVLLSVINNSIDALEKIQDNRKKKIEIEVKWEDEYIKCIICDNGIGIKTEVIENIFDPFFSTKNDRAGNGLEMSIAFDIIQNRNKGEIYFESEENIGSKLTILLPLECE